MGTANPEPVMRPGDLIRLVTDDDVNTPVWKANDGQDRAKWVANVPKGSVGLLINLWEDEALVLFGQVLGWNTTRHFEQVGA